MSLPEKLSQLEFLVKTITHCRLAEDGDCGTAISIRFLDHPEQKVCDIPTALSRPDGVASVTVVNAGKTYTYAMTDIGGSCNQKQLNVSVHLYNLRSAEAHSADTELGSGELVVKPYISIDGCCPTIADGDDITVPMTDCQGLTVAVLSVRVRAWVAGTVTVTPINSPPLCPRLPSLECCIDSGPVIWAPPTFCSNKPSTRKQKSCCEKIAREPSPYSSKCVKTCPITDQCELSTIDIDTDIGCEIDVRVRKQYDSYDTQRRLAQEAERFISKVAGMVKDMHRSDNDTVDIAD